MIQPVPTTSRILVATDFSRDSERAFFHALAFAVARRARLTILHTGPESRDEVPWEQFPGVRETLTAWGKLPADAPRSAVQDELRVGVAKMAVRDGGPRKGIAEYLRRHPTDLLVMTNEGHIGLGRMFGPSIAETVGYLTKSNTLMLPGGGHQLVEPTSGEAALGKVLCAVSADAQVDMSPASAYLQDWLPAFGGAGAEVHLLRLGPTGDEQSPPRPQGVPPGWRYSEVGDDDTNTIVDTAREIDAEMIVVCAPRPSGLATRLRGTRIDHILRALRLPLLALPPPAIA